MPKNAKNISILKYGLIAVALCFMISVVVYMQYSLKETVFLDHYYERNIHDGSYMNIHFIKNTNDDRKIIDISFPQLPEDFAYVQMNAFPNSFNNGYYRSEKFAHYSYNVLAIELHCYENNENEKQEESIVLDKAVVSYNNGEKQEVDIGKIVLHKNAKQYGYFDSTYNSSSSDFTASTRVKSQKNIIIKDISSDLDTDVSDFLELKFNGEDINTLSFPIAVNTDDYLTFDSRFSYDSQDVRKYNAYDIEKRVMLIDDEGNSGHFDIYNINYEPFEILINEDGIREFLKYKGVK